MISTYIATYKYGVFSSKNEKQHRKFLEKFLVNGVAIFAMDSTSNFYASVNNKVTGIPFEVEYKYGQMQANVEFDSDFISKLPEFHQIYIMNSIGYSIFERNLFPGNIENDYISLFLPSIVIHINNQRVFAYPVLKLYRSGIIIIDLTIYSSDEDKSDLDYVDFLVNLRFDEFSKIQLHKQLCDYKKLDRDKPEVISRDGISKEYFEYKGNDIKNLKDLAIFLVDEIIDDRLTYIAHHNFAIEADNISDEELQSLMSGIPLEEVKDFKPIIYENYREFNNSFKHYVSIANTVTVGEIELTRIPSLVIDELFLYMAINIFKLRSVVSSKEKSIDEVLELYKQVINLNGFLINGLSAYQFSKKIFDDLFSEYKMYSQLDNVKELIEVEIKKLEIKKSRKELNHQNIIAVVLTLLTSEAILTYFIKPFYLFLTKKNNDDLSANVSTILYFVPLLIVTFVIFTRFIFNIFKKIINRFA